MIRSPTETDRVLGQIREMLYQERGRLIGKKLELRRQKKETDAVRADLRVLAKLMNQVEYAIERVDFQWEHWNDKD